MTKLKAGQDLEAESPRRSGNPHVKWLLLLGGLGGFLACSAVFYLWLYSRQVQNGYRLSKLYAEHEQLSIVQRKLRLEWSRFQDLSQMEELGRSRFGLAPPRPEQKVFLPRTNL